MRRNASSPLPCNFHLIAIEFQQEAEVILNSRESSTTKTVALVGLNPVAGIKDHIGSPTLHPPGAGIGYGCRQNRQTASR